MVIHSSRRCVIRNCKRVLYVLALCLGASACGQVGPLYLPGDNVKDERGEPSSVPVDASEEDSDREEDTDSATDDR